MKYLLPQTNQNPTKNPKQVKTMFVKVVLGKTTPQHDYIGNDYN